MKNKAIKARVVDTGKLIKVKDLDKYGFYEDVKTGEKYCKYDLNILPKKHMVQFGFRIWRVGFFLFAREYWKYNNWYLFPGLSVSGVNGYDRYLDAEVKLLFFGFGVRFIWIKKK